MAIGGQQRSSSLGKRLATSAFAMAMALAVAVAVTQPAQAQAFKVLHTFTDGADGASPIVGLTMDRSGNLDGTAAFGGLAGGCGGYGCGTVYKLSHQGSGWIFSPLYAFSGSSDGAIPLARVIIGPNGTLYGTAFAGGNAYGSSGSGVVFNLSPPAHVPPRVFSSWIETVLHQFGAPTSDGTAPEGDLTFDQAGNIYGTTSAGGVECQDTVYCGTVFELAPNGTGWTETILYKFTNGDVSVPQSGVILDPSGNLYGTTWNSPGAVFQLTASGPGWTEHTLYQFGYLGGGFKPAGGLILDPSGNLYGTTEFGGANGGGTAYEMKPSGGGWIESDIYSLTGGPMAGLVRDVTGNLYGTTCSGGAYNGGTVFRLTPSGGSWTETDLYDFTGGNDGYCPLGNVTLDASGNVYGTAWAGGSGNFGVVFEITP